MMGLHKALCFGFTVFLLYMNALPEGVIYNIANCTYFKCVQVSDFRQQLEFVSEVESGHCDTVDRSKKLFFNFNAGKTV